MASFRLWKSGFRENGNSAPAGSTEGGGTVLTIASLDGEPSRHLADVFWGYNRAR